METFKTFDPSKFIQKLESTVGIFSKEYPCQVREKKQCPDQLADKPDCSICSYAWNDGIALGDELNRAGIAFFNKQHIRDFGGLTQTHIYPTSGGTISVGFEGRNAPYVMILSRRKLI